MRLLPALAAILALVPRPASAWGLHYLVTDRALSNPATRFTETEKVRVEPLEAFVQAQRKELTEYFRLFAAWMEKNDSRHSHLVAFDAAKADRQAFLAAARLNPDTTFPLVRRLLPGEAAPAGSREVSIHEFSPNEKTMEPFQYRFIDVTGQEMTARSVLVTFADEPDWRMDEALFFEHPELGYGTQPYGDPKGTASRAPFHMLFRHENIIVQTFAPEMTQGLTPDRVELFTGLARVAFKTGHPYWGYRFTSWALHYIEDLGQPYHSKAVPSAELGYYVKFMFSPDKQRIKKETTQLVKNRHFAYEDFVAYALQQGYLEKKDLFNKLAAYLSDDGAEFPGLRDPQEILDQVGKFAASHAAAIDRAIIEAYGPHYTEDPGYDLETDPNYHVQSVVASLSPKAAADILTETGKDFTSTGKGARTLVISLCKR